MVVVPGAGFVDFWRVGWAGPLALEGDGSVVRHLGIATRALVSCPGLLFRCWEAWISDRISAIAGALIFAFWEGGGVGNPTVSGGCGQFSPGEHAHQRCLRIGSAAQEQGAKSGCRVRCPGLGFHA